MVPQVSGDALPIAAALPALLGALAERSVAVLVAPPGAGKTTAVAPALLAQPWCTGEIILLSPRRLAARAAAERMAAAAGEGVGGTYGYRTRMDARIGPGTRVSVVTEGIFVARIQADPELAGVSAVLFDEVHERSLDGDTALAFALEAQAALRPDLRLVAMSATLDGARFASLMADAHGPAAVIESEGRRHPLRVRYLGRSPAQSVEDAVAGAIRRALAEETGGVLAFLPGVAEIERVARRLEPIPAGVALHLLHGAAEPAAQRAAIQPEPQGLRKLVLATAIAETSLTLDGVAVVVDSGLARRARYDRGAGMTRLATERVSQASATQRAGRAARQGPGVAYRLWEEAATGGLAPFDPPAILESDLSALVLAAGLWGTDAERLAWLDPPPPAALAEARERLAMLGAIDADARPTPHGRRLAGMPMEPRLAHMLLAAGEAGLAATGAQVAVLLGERGLGGDEVDLERRMERWRHERRARAQGARSLAARWRRLAGGDDDGAAAPADAVARCVALAYPDRVARRRDANGERWASVGGRGFRLDPALPLARSQWLAVGEVQGAAAGARILAAAALDEAAVAELFADRIAHATTVSFDPGNGGVSATRERRLGRIMLQRGPDPDASPAAIRDALVAGVRRHGLALLPWSDADLAWRARAGFAGVDMSDATLIDRLDEWLPPLLGERRRLDAIPAGALGDAMRALVGGHEAHRIDTLAPSHFTSPAGTRAPIDYAAAAGPTVEVRPQALFGSASHPCIGRDRVPLVLCLVSPAGRPIQTTRDLPGFWANGWREVVKEMRGRYPRHPWPDDPAAAQPTTRTKNADARLNKGR